MSTPAQTGLQRRVAHLTGKAVEQAARLNAFATRYPLADLPDDLFTVDLTGPAINVHLTLAPDEAGRQKVLAHLGAEWGNAGWQREDNYERYVYNWVRVTEGVILRIYHAEKIEPISTPVPPSHFPLLLE